MLKDLLERIGFRIAVLISENWSPELAHHLSIAWLQWSGAFLGAVDAKIAQLDARVAAKDARRAAAPPPTIPYTALAGGVLVVVAAGGMLWQFRRK